MSEMFSRRVFLRGLGVVAAAAALTACSSTNEAVNQALIEGAVGGIVAKDCILGTSRFRSASSDVPIYYVGAKIVLTNVSSKSVTLSGDNFDTVLDGTRLTQPKFSAQDIGGPKSGALMTTSPSGQVKSVPSRSNMSPTSQPMRICGKPAILRALLSPAAASA